MIAIGKGISAIRPLLVSERHDLAMLVLNSASHAEANLALGLLDGDAPQRALVDLVNLREVLAELPHTPMPMAVDFESLARIAGLERVGNAWALRCENDSRGPFELVVLGEGNMCYDLVVRADGETVFWTQYGDEPPLVHPAALLLAFEYETLLPRVVDLVQAMGLPFNPTFYLSLDDFRLEHAEDSIDDLIDGLFGF